MTVTLPINTGKADWTNYTDYWREEDAEWIQERTVLRYADPAARAVDWPQPTKGQVTFNVGSDRLEVFAGAGAWSTVQHYVNLTKTQDDAAGVGLAHIGAVSKGIVFEPTQVSVSHKLNVLGGVLTAETTGVSIKTGTKVAKLTTDAANLVSDSPISAPSIAVTGALTAGSITLPVGSTLTAPNISMTGTLTGGVLNGSSGTIGGVAIASNKVTAAAGFDVQGGSFYGDGGSGIMRHVNRTGPYVQVTTGGINLHGGGVTDVYNQMRIFTNAVQYIRSDGVHTGYLATSFYGDPGVANAPEGSILIQ